MNWHCLFGHKWKVLKYQNYTVEKIPSFSLIYICTDCKAIYVKEICGFGYLTNEQFYEIREETNVKQL